MILFEINRHFLLRYGKISCGVKNHAGLAQELLLE